MDFTMQDLKKCFNVASNKGFRYIGVKIQMEGFPKPEVIINESENFNAKLAYYQKAYNEDLTLKAFNGIKIIGFTYGNDYDEIESDFVRRVNVGM